METTEQPKAKLLQRVFAFFLAFLVLSIVGSVTREFFLLILLFSAPVFELSERVNLLLVSGCQFVAMVPAIYLGIKAYKRLIKKPWRRN